MRETGTFDYEFNQNNTDNFANTVREIFNAESAIDTVARNIDSRVRYSVGVFVESIRLTIYLPSFIRAKFPETYPEDSAAERANKLLEVESQYPKCGLAFYRRQADHHDWKKLGTVILQNRGRESQLSVLIPYLTTNQIKILNRKDRIGVSSIDYGDGHIGQGAIESNRDRDYVSVEGEYRIDIDTDSNLVPAVSLRKRISETISLSGRKLFDEELYRASFEIQNTGDNDIFIGYGSYGLLNPFIIKPGQMYHPPSFRGLCVSDEVWIRAVKESSTYTAYEYFYSYAPT